MSTVLQHSRLAAKIVVLLLHTVCVWHSALAESVPETDAARSPALVGYFVVLMFHHVADDTPASTSVSPERFEEILALIKAQGFTVRPLAELVSGVFDGEGVPARSVALTFDDGYRSVFDNAWPLLEARDWPFTVFVQGAPLPQGSRLFMGLDELQTLAQAGVTIANHGQTHCSLAFARWRDAEVHADEQENKRRWQAMVREEIDTAAAWLEQIVTEEISHAWIAYPYGEFDQPLLELAQTQGWIGFGQQSGAIDKNSDRRALPRYPVNNSISDNQLWVRLQSRPMPVEVIYPSSRTLADHAMAPELHLRLSRAEPIAATVSCFTQSGIPLQVTGGTQDAGTLAEQVLVVHPMRDGQRMSAAELSGGSRRAKYTCTAPVADQPGAWWWYSHLWLLGDAPAA